MGHGDDGGWCEKAMTVFCPSGISLLKGKGVLGTRKGRRGHGVSQALVWDLSHEQGSLPTATGWILSLLEELC